MNPRPTNLPALYVEGNDDVSVVAALLKKHGVDTKRGEKHLWIQPFGNIEELLEAMPLTIKTNRNLPCGFVLDIDIEVTHRWKAVKERLKFSTDPSVSLSEPVADTCPPGGFFGQIKDFPARFGVWLMPDCKTDGQMLEHLISTLMRPEDPLWPHAKSSTAEAARIVDRANEGVVAGGGRWERFADKVRIKAEVRSWLAWQREPGVALGAAINDQILRNDSPEALAFLRWLKELYGFDQLTDV